MEILFLAAIIFIQFQVCICLHEIKKLKVANKLDESTGYKAQIYAISNKKD